MSTIGSVIVSLARRDLLAKEKILLKHPKVGGLVLFAENFFTSSETDLRALITEIRLKMPEIVKNSLPPRTDYLKDKIAEVVAENPSLLIKNSTVAKNDLEEFLLKLCLDNAKLLAKNLTSKELSNEELTKFIAEIPNKYPKIVLRDASSAKEDLKKLVADIRAINPKLLIMVDHEGGKVWRFTHGFTRIPAAKTIGEQYAKNKDVALKAAFDYGFLMASELRDCDIDYSLAPVVDLDGDSNIIGGWQRAYHSDLKVVAEIAEQSIRGMNQAGMPATLKHFPGHGSCKLDSHVEKPVDNRSWKELEIDLTPFRELCKKTDLAFAVMAAHVTYPKVDPKYAAGFSKKWIEEILRKDCKFSGVVMSDCLSMKGADIGTPDKRIIASQAAGCDFQMCTHQKGEDLDTLLASLDKIPDNKTSEERRQAFANSLQKKMKLDAELAKRLDGVKALLSAANTVTSTVTATATHVAAPVVIATIAAVKTAKTSAAAAAATAATNQAQQSGYNSPNN
jgi:beta-N-acetylhexosaminidase